MGKKVVDFVYGRFGILWCVVFLFLTMFFSDVLSANQPQMDNLSETAVIKNVQKLRMPFIANEGQAEEKVAYYANTFGGTVFVTKEGEIVYALPNNSSDVETQGIASLMHSPDWIHDAGCGMQDNQESYIKPCRLGKSENPPPPPKSQPLTPNIPLQGIALKETLVGTKIKEIKGEGKSVTKVNYFRGNDQNKWKSNIPTYDVVDLGEIYNGIELKLKAYGNNVEKLFHVKPGANPEQIQISLSGIQPPGNPPPLSPSVRGTGVCPPLAGVGGGLEASGLFVNEQGQLVAETALGPVTFTRPIAYQEIDGKRVYVDVEYTISHSMTSFRAESRNLSHQWYNPIKNAGYWIHGNQESCIMPFVSASNSQTYNPSTLDSTTPQLSNSETPQLVYSFKVASYDKTKELVIDPLLASTYVGGSADDNCYSIAIDSEENIYLVGSTYSEDFPVFSGSYDNSYDSRRDVFISKINSDLSDILASTYLGGNSEEYGYSVAIDTSDYVYITGYTYSSDFPVSADAYSTTKNDSKDVFVSKFNSELTNLIASTYLGGDSVEEGHSIVIGLTNDIYVSGYTKSSDFPTTSSAYDTSHNGNEDVFISRLDSNLTTIYASTYLGGSYEDYCYSMLMGDLGDIYIAGDTESSNFPATSDAYDNSFGGDTDVFVAKISNDLSNLLASTYLGGTEEDYGRSIAKDGEDNIFVCGYTESSNFPALSDAYDNTFNDSSGYGPDVFISKFDKELTDLKGSSYAGTNSDDYGRCIAIDTEGNVYVIGDTKSESFPTTSNAYDTTYNDGGRDIFISKFDNELTDLISSTYLGGSDYDYGYSILIDSLGNVYAAGYTDSSDFPITNDAYDDLSKYEEIWITRLDSNLSSEDTVSPTGSILINSGDTYSNSSLITVELSASDNVGVTGYYLSTSSSTPSSSASGWTSVSSTTSYSASVSYTVNSGDGAKAVYVWYKDSAGNVSGTYSDSITLDTTAPTVSITSPTSDTTYSTTSSTISLSGSASDSTSGVSGVAWSNGATGSSGTASGTTSWSVSGINLSSGNNTITITATDNAGNASTDTLTVTYNGTTLPTPTPTPSTGGNTGLLELSKSEAYLDGDSIVVAITDVDLNISGGKDHSTVSVKSSADGTSVALTLTETASNSTTFSGTFSTAKSTDSSASPVKIKAEAGGYITVRYSDANPGGDITQKVTTKNFGAYLYITEEIELDGNAMVSLYDPESNTSITSTNSVNINISSTSDSTGTTLSLTETGKDTGSFSGSINVSSNDTEKNNNIKADVGDTITVSFTDDPDADGYVSVVTDTATVIDTSSIPVPSPTTTPAYSETGTVGGFVTDEDSGNPINGATVRNQSGLYSGTTDSTGYYQITDIPAGSYTFTATASGYISESVSGVDIESGETTVVDFSLTASSPSETPDASPTPATATLIIYVYDTDDNPVEGATVSVSGKTEITDSNGTATFDDIAVGDYVVTVSKTGYTTNTVEVTVVDDAPITIQSITLSASTNKDDFEVVNSLVTDISTNDFDNKYSGCETPPENTIFCDGDKRVSLWFQYKNAKKGDAHVSEWYTPSGDLYLTDNETYGFKDGCWIISMLIRNRSVASELGEWQIKVYRNDELIFTEKFTINECIIYGTVMDTFEEPIELVKLKLKSKGGKPNIKEETYSGEDGYFEFTNLKRGVYKLKATKNGYEKSNKKIEISDGEDKEVNLVLEEK